MSDGQLAGNQQQVDGSEPREQAGRVGGPKQDLDGTTEHERLDKHVERQQRALPEVARARLREEVGGIDRGQPRQRRSGYGQ